MNALVTPHDVVLRFAKVRRAILTHRLLAAAICGVGSFATIVLMFATIDFFVEFAYSACLVGLGLSIIVAALTVGLLAYRAIRLGSTRRAAAEMEHHFATIGQRLRTTIDLAGRDGVDKLPLTTALATETLEKCDSVDLESIVPRKQTLWCAVAVVGIICLLFSPSLISSNWNTALARALGSDRPYTELSVQPGDLVVDEGTPVELKLKLTGRLDRDVALHVGIPGKADEPWQIVDLKRSEGDASNEAFYVGSLGPVKEARMYRFVTSAGQSDVHEINVRYPVRIEAIELTVKRPEYTGLDDRVYEKTDVTVLEGSEVVCRIRSQRPLDEVDVAFSPVGQWDPEKALPPETLDATKNEDGTQWVFRFTAGQDTRWVMRGADPAGTPMDPVNGQVRVKVDRPPKLRWSSPGDSLFVHTLAEVPMSVRVEDDYGLTEAAIRFEISGNDGYSLDAFDLSQVDPEAGPQPRKVLEQILPLEHFPLTEKDYVAYYAYAIDNRPGEPQYVESERRYIDIRQLKLDVLLPDEEQDNDGQAREALASLDELIGRQRYLINRTRTLRSMDEEELTEKLGLLDRHVSRQTDLADITRLVAERLQERGNDNLDAMFQAEGSMIQAADSLTLADFESALPQQEDAQRFLVEARTELERRLGNGGQRRSVAGQRNNMTMLRMVRQRLRREGENGEAAAARQLVARIRGVASSQLNIAAEMQSQSAGGSSSQEPDDADPTPDTQDSNQPDSNQDPQSQQDPESPPSDQASDESDPADSPGDGQDPDTNEAQEPEDPEETPAQTLAERQTELLDELNEIQDEIANMSWPSELVPDRADAAVEKMDDLTAEVSGSQPSADKVETESKQLAGALMELALNIELVNPPEPSGRLSGTRDLTASLAMLEQELAATARQANPDDDTDMEEEIEQQASDVRSRAETLEDVARAAADANDAGSEQFADAIAQWLAENPLLDTAGVSKEKAEELEQSDRKGGLAEETADEREERAGKLNEMADSLNNAMREMLEPELERLRQLEQQGAQLAEQMDQEGSASEGEVAEFAEDLQKGKFEESSEKIMQSLANGPSGDSALRENLGVRGAVRYANDAIRERIRELILREVEADRDGPVPPEYRTAVDDYFRRVIDLAK